MHFEILVEDVSGKTALDILVPKIVGEQHSFRIHSYKGSGRLPKNLKSTSDPKKRILLDQLPRLIRGYDKAFSSQSDYSLIVVCDLDSRCLKEFRKELLECLDSCNTSLMTYFCIAIEEGEAWYLGDLDAVRKAYPNAKSAVLNTYVNDSICNTWEKLADAIVVGGSTKLSKLKGQAGMEKSVWAKTITPYMNVDKNLSPSFCYFRDTIRSLLNL
jgi:hypothetical protein